MYSVSLCKVYLISFLIINLDVWLLFLYSCQGNEQNSTVLSIVGVMFDVNKAEKKTVLCIKVF